MLITHQTHIDTLPESPLKAHIQARFLQFNEPEENPPVFVRIELGDDIAGPDYAFVGANGLLSDLFEESTLGEDGFVRPYEWVSYLPSLQLYEVLLLVNSEDGYWILIPEDIVEAHPDLKWILTSDEQGGLSDPRPL